MKEFAPFVAVAGMFVLVKTIIRNTYRNPKAMFIGMLGGVPLSALVGLTVMEETGKIYLSLLITSATALVVEHLMAAVIDYGEKNAKSIISKFIK